MSDRPSAAVRAELEEAAYRIRRLTVEMITWGQWGHIGGSFSMAELLAVLYFHSMGIDPAVPDWEARDRFVLSKAHGSPRGGPAVGLRHHRRGPASRLDQAT